MGEKGQPMPEFDEATATEEFIDRLIYAWEDYVFSSASRPVHEVKTVGEFVGFSVEKAKESLSKRTLLDGLTVRQRRENARAREWGLVICVENGPNLDPEPGPSHDLTLMRVYKWLKDDLAAETGFIRIVDDCGEDYLYPAHWFVPLDTPVEVLEEYRAKHCCER